MRSSEILELCTNSSSVRLYDEAPETITDDATALHVMTPGPTSPSTPSICLLQGPLEEFVRYSRQEAAKWLIDLAHDICDPAQQRGSLLVWKEPQQEWSLVAPTDPLTVSTYRYDLPDQTTVGLSKINERENKSKTTATGAPSTMRTHVLDRDRGCWVTRSALVKNSHICPKRMGDHNGRYIYKTFTGITPDPALSIYNKVFGLCLSDYLDARFYVYHLGFRLVSTNDYKCHVFTDIPGQIFTIAGAYPESSPLANVTALHGYHISPPNPQSTSNPPPGLFRWHYLQCVIKKFGHDDYKKMQNIVFLVQSLPIEGDSDEDSTDSEADWPSKAFDLGRAAMEDLRECEERHRAVATWVELT